MYTHDSGYRCHNQHHNTNTNAGSILCGIGAPTACVHICAEQRCSAPMMMMLSVLPMMTVRRASCTPPGSGYLRIRSSGGHLSDYERRSAPRPGYRWSDCRWVWVCVFFCVRASVHECHMRQYDIIKTFPVREAASVGSDEYILG